MLYQDLVQFQSLIARSAGARGRAPANPAPGRAATTPGAGPENSGGAPRRGRGLEIFAGAGVAASNNRKYLVKYCKIKEYLIWLNNVQKSNKCSIRVFWRGQFLFLLDILVVH